MENSRGNNLIVDGILETPGEAWKGCEKKLQQVFQEKRGLEFPIEIEQAHQTSSRQNNMSNGNNLPPKIICKLLRYKGKVRGTHIFIKEEFSRERMELWKMLWKKVKIYCDIGRVALIYQGFK